MAKLKVRLKLGGGVRWEALGPIPEPFSFTMDANCTTLALKQYLSHNILDGVFEPSSLQLRLQGRDTELEDVADAGGPTTSAHQPRLRRLASQGVCNGSLLQLDVLATEEELQRYLEEAEARAVENEMRDYEDYEEDEEDEEAQTPPRPGAEGAGQRRRHAASGAAAAAGGGEGPAERPSLGVMHTPAGTVGTYLDDDEDADYLEEDLEEDQEQVEQQQPGQQQQQEEEEYEELDDLNVAPEGEPFEAEEFEECEEQQAGEAHAAGAGEPQQGQEQFVDAEEEYEEEEGGEDSQDLGLRPAAAQPAARPAQKQAAAVAQQPQPKVNPRVAGKRPREEEAEELDLVSGSEDEGDAQPPRQQQRTNGAAAVGAAGRSRGATTPTRAAATAAAGAPAPDPARVPRPAPPRSTGLPPDMQPAVDTGAFGAYGGAAAGSGGGGAGGSAGKYRASPSFWGLEETKRLVDWVERHGAREWTVFLANNSDIMNRNMEQVKMRWRNLKASSEKGWRDMRRIVIPADLRARIDALVSKKAGG